ncbi:MAG: hypothetical protein RBR97_17665 [Bacteroidales bacterium]|nr:hypothetical protein [Bacteroidales bacterium]
MKTILVTGIGGPTPRSIVKAIKNLGHNYRIIGIDANPKALGFYIPNLIDKGYLAPKMDNPLYWPFIENLIIDESIDMAFVQPEVEVVGWGKYFDNNGKFPCPVFIPPHNLALSLMDKSIMADLLAETKFIPKTIKVTQDNPRYDEVKKRIGFPCWIRATKGSGGLGSLKIEDIDNYKSWLFINKEINEFTVSEFLPGRHLATQMLYFNGEYIKGASLECVEYVMASIAPSKVTGNTSFGRFINENKILDFSNECIKFVSKKLNIPAHGVLSVDLKEDSSGNLKITEVNIRHMAYTGVMADAGLNLIEDTILLLEKGIERIQQNQYYQFDKPYVFLRDVDIEPIILESEDKLKI